MRVLIADDDQITRRMLRGALQGWRYAVQEVEDGDAALDALCGPNAPRLAIVNWMMPGVDGVEVCRRVRDTPGAPPVYIIMLTARRETADIVKGLTAGADDYVCKPIDTGELRARVKVGERMVELQRERLEQETLRYVRRLEDTVAELQRSRRRIVDVQEEDRRAIAEELHGPVQTRLFMLSVKLGEVRDTIDGSHDQGAQDLVQAIAELDEVRETEIRQLSHRLHPSILSVGLGAGINSLRDSYERWVPVHLKIADEVVRREPVGLSTIPFFVRLGLYRVADEALANVVKHAGAGEVRLGLDLDADTLCLSVADDGKGFERSAASEGLGTVTMTDYIGALGGSLALETAPGRGTRVVATVPLEGAADQVAAD